ncbi:zf-LYAR-domain-containing protein [Nadsonia fulvescens var. elongata DSM 6958]|uniref:Zf-LYAR-domain-containing protein n=1 Tax=Nadsonia fulvescens var. elongata DSM 6958 TaxID=857566 RepID=A0A1E3PJB0_9ASCO|nr:zf-LYAR-domain-containing protein [Nadsonia fulvescens var. elongata DSM 6958]
MVSFSCEVCNDTVKKAKLMAHKGQCYGAYFTCIDCSTTFQGNEFQSHTSCISEAEKYQKALFRPKNAQKQQQTKSTPSEKPESKKSKNLATFVTMDNTPVQLYKVLKDVCKSKKLDKKDLLKSLTITKNSAGEFSIEF